MLEDKGVKSIDEIEIIQQDVQEPVEESGDRWGEIESSFSLCRLTQETVQFRPDKRKRDKQRDRRERKSHRND